MRMDLWRKRQEQEEVDRHNAECLLANSIRASVPEITRCDALKEAARILRERTQA